MSEQHPHEPHSQHSHEHSHEHEHEHAKRALSPIELRVRALEALLTEKGYIDPAALDVLIDAYQTKIGPRNG
ncbi:MAG TPA: nitrile hydratase subunit alpha, partial [Steroidobacteraceae bacterium]|nr:nitrile hydratase subunit alpha [Steroidobacteraceae bacterium]